MKATNTSITSLSATTKDTKQQQQTFKQHLHYNQNNSNNTKMIHILKAQNDRRAKKQGSGREQNEWGEPTSAFHLTNQPRSSITGKIFFKTKTILIINNSTHKIMIYLVLGKSFQPN